MEQIALRRTKSQKVKGKLLVDLPTKKVFIQHVELSADERAVYDSMAKEGRLAIGKWVLTLKSLELVGRQVKKESSL